MLQFQIKFPDKRHISGKFNYILYQAKPLHAMKQEFHYATITEAIEQLHKQGYTLDFNMKKEKLIADGKEYVAIDFEIADLYRYEGASDPADESTVYALVSESGLKGLLVSGYGISSDSESEETIKHLHYKYQQANSQS
ncbi:MAG TPA: hypothetical protein VK671_03420 [Mucilaginibacter sp.]|jgi:hypothetical protein|nr:hypothetical protein [Mucilaginibacter sp.]